MRTSRPKTPSLLNHVVVQMMSFQIGAVDVVPERWFSASWLINQQLEINHANWYPVLHAIFYFRDGLNRIVQLQFLGAERFYVGSFVGHGTAASQRWQPSIFQLIKSNFTHLLVHIAADVDGHPWLSFDSGFGWSLRAEEESSFGWGLGCDGPGLTLHG